MLWPLGSWPQWPQPRELRGGEHRGRCPARQPCHLGYRWTLPAWALARPRANHQFYSCEDGSPRFINNKKYDDLPSPEACCCPQTPGGFSLCPRTREPVVRGLGSDQSGGHCHSCIGLGRAMPLITTFRGCTNPSSLRSLCNLTSMLQCHLQVCTPLSAWGLTGQPTRPKRGHPRYKAPQGPEGTQQAEAQAQ